MAHNLQDEGNMGDFNIRQKKGNGKLNFNIYYGIPEKQQFRN